MSFCMNGTEGAMTLYKVVAGSSTTTAELLPVEREAILFAVDFVSDTQLFDPSFIAKATLERQKGKIKSKRRC